MRIFRISNFLFLGIAVFFGVLLFWTSQSVQQKEDQLDEIRQQLVQEQETVRVLSVEWDYLNRPQRLEQLASEQLGMTLPSAKEVVRDVADIPEPLMADPDAQSPMTQTVSLTTSVPKIQASPKKETVTPGTAEKQSFDRLIQSLDAGNGE